MALAGYAQHPSEERNPNEVDGQLSSTCPEIMVQSLTQDFYYKLNNYLLKEDFNSYHALMMQKSEENKIYIRDIQKSVNSTLSKSGNELKEGAKKMENEMKRRIQTFLNNNTLKPEEIKALITAKAGKIIL